MGQDVVGQIVERDRREEERPKGKGDWTRKDNAKRMRWYSRNLYSTSREEGIQHYGCYHCGLKDVTKRYTTTDLEGNNVGRYMDWPALRRRGWPKEYRIYCPDCSPVKRGMGWKDHELGQMVDGDQYLLFPLGTGGSLPTAMMRWEIEASKRNRMGENVTCSMESVLRFVGEKMLMMQGIRSEWPDLSNIWKVWELSPLYASHKKKRD